MADFDKAIPFVLQWEGGYSNRENDLGGETYAGITRKDNPRWVGWAFIDEQKKKGAIKNNTKFKELTECVAPHYRLNYWNKIQGDKIKDQQAAGFLLDWFVNSGYHAVKAIQKIVDVTPDSIMGTNTIRAINAYKGDLTEELRKARIAFVRNIVAQRPSQIENLDGWLNRINNYVVV